MQRLAMLFVSLTLAATATPALCANSAGDLPRADRMAAARGAEQKGDLARAHENFASALDDYQQAIRYDPQNSVLLNKLGIAEFKLGNRKAARKHFTQAVTCNPRNVSALNNLGALALVEKKYKTAVSHLKQALALDELSATAHLNIAEAWMGLEQIDRAMTEYARALELDADILTPGRGGLVAQVSTPQQRARVSYLIARAYAKRGNLDGALEYLGRAKEGNFPDLANVYTDQEFAALWVDPRLQKIVKR